MSQSAPKIYGLIGYPLGHSFSKGFFNEKFETEGINASYVNFEIPQIEDFPKLFTENPTLAGLNVTIPYKQKVMAYLDSLDPEAEKIGAVNVIKIIRGDNGEIAALRGYNSDIIGFVESIRPLLKPWHRKALVLGTGGGSRAICQGLLNLGIAPQLVSRSSGPDRISYQDITPEILNEHKVIVNTTPLGMYPHVDECPDLPYYLLNSEYLCYDLTYNPEVTLFLKKSAEKGAATKNGYEMLVKQALAAWQIWNW